MTRPTQMRRWDQALSVFNLSPTTDDLNILLFGASNTYGGGTSSRYLRFPEVAARKLASTFGMGVGVHYPVEPSPPSPWPLDDDCQISAFGGVFDTSAFGLSRRSWYSGSAVEHLSISTNKPCVRINFLGTTTTGKAEIIVDGVSAGVFDTKATPAAGFVSKTVVWKSDNLGPGTHLITVKYDSVSAIFVEGVVITDRLLGNVIVHPAGHSGFQASDHSYGLGGWLPASVAATKATLIIVEEGLNEQMASKTPTTMSNEILALVNAAVARLSTPSVALMTEWANYFNKPPNTWPPYATAIRNLATTQGYGLIDTYASVHDSANTLYPLTTDLIHPNDLGHQLWGDITANYLLEPLA